MTFPNPADTGFVASKPQRVVAVLFALVPAVGAGVLLLFLLFLVAFPFENSEPMTRSEEWLFALLFTAAAAACFLALLSAYFIAIARLLRARTAYAAHLAIALAFVAWGLSESEHSDGTIVGIALGIELAGILSMVLAGGRPSSLAG